MAVKASSVEVGCVEVRFGMVRQLRHGTFGRVGYWCGLAVEASFGFVGSVLMG